MIIRFFCALAALFLLAGPALAVPAGMTPASAQQPAAYLGQVVTRNYMPRGNITATGAWAMSAMTVFVRDNITAPIVKLGACKVSSQTETCYTGGQITAKVAIEYPMGTCTLADENIVAGGSVATAGTVPLTNTITDFHFSTLSIPNGAQIVERVYQSGSTVLFTQFQGGGGGSENLLLTSDGLQNGTTNPVDLTDCSAPVPTGFNNGFAYSPLATVAMTRNPSALLVGDSLVEGGPEGVSDKAGDAGTLARTIGRSYGYISIAEAATTLQSYLAGTRTMRDQLFAFVSTAVDQYVLNDVGALGLTPAVIAGERQSFAVLAKTANPNITVIGTTSTPYVGTTDGFATKANQTLGSNEPKILAFNDLERAGIPGEDYYWDIADALDPYRTGFWPVDRNPNDTAISPTASFTASIASFNLNTTGTLTKGSMTITSVASTTGLLIGQQVVAFVPGMPFGTTITAISGSTVTMSTAYSGTTTTGAAINFSGGTLAVTAVASGTLTVGMLIWNANAASGTTITALGTGTGSTGNYQVNKQQTVASGTFTTGGFCTLEGLHPTYICSQLIRDRGAINLNFMKRAPKPGAANDDLPWWELRKALAAG